jgi:lysophospholipase L1-like esterase
MLPLSTPADAAGDQNESPAARALIVGDSTASQWRAAWRSSAVRDALNLGKAGSRPSESVGWLARKRIAYAEVRTIVVSTGTNSLATDTPPEIARAIFRLADWLREKAPQAKIALLTVTPRGEGLASYAEQIAALNGILSANADRHGYHLVDTHSAFSSRCRVVGRCPLYQRDNLHYTRLGYHVIGELVDRALGV